MKPYKDSYFAVIVSACVSFLALILHLLLGHWAPNHLFFLLLHPLSLGSTIAIAWYIWRTRSFEKKRGNNFFFAFTVSGVLLTMTLFVVNVLGTFFSPKTIDWIIAYHSGEIYSYIFANAYLWVCYFTNLRYFWPLQRNYRVVQKEGVALPTNKRFKILFFEIEKFEFGQTI